MKNETLEIISTRRSIKGYTDKPVPRDILDKIIKAGTEAASGRNLQGAIIVAVTNREIRDKLSEANANVLGAKSDPFYNAPTVLVVLANKNIRTSIYDASLVAGNIMLAAHALGVGSCWIHRAREVFDMPEWRQWLSSIGVEGEYEGVANMVIGYPKGDYPEKKQVLPGRVFFVD